MLEAVLRMSEEDVLEVRPPASPAALAWHCSGLARECWWWPCVCAWFPINDNSRGGPQP